MKSDKEIIELRPEKPDQGEIRYTYAGSPQRSEGVSGFLTKFLGILIGVGMLILFVFFFVYVILPVIAALIIWTLLKKLFTKNQ